MFRYNAILGRTKTGVTSRGTYTSLGMLKLRPLLMDDNVRIPDHRFIAQPHVCRYLKNRVFPELDQDYRNALGYALRSSLDDSKIQFVIGDDSMVSAALLNPKLDLLLVTDWDDCPDGPNMLFPTVFHKSFMHLPPCMHSFHAYELKQKIWLV